jgi:succinate-semialdehyde dehydrogenase/glutarate-semialdehyde dehydrogenase
VREAVSLGARLLEGGQRHGAVLSPTVLTDITPEMHVSCDELFAPVVSIVPFTSPEAVIEEINASPYGLATGLFTRDVMRALNMAKRIHAGIVHINEPSSSRADLMPFAGVKDSGLGREGPRYAMQEMTEERLITISLS